MFNVTPSPVQGLPHSYPSVKTCGVICIAGDDSNRADYHLNKKQCFATADKLSNKLSTIQKLSHNAT